MPFWEFERREEQRRRDAETFGQRMRGQAFTRMARESMQARGMDPDLVPSLHTPLASLTPEEVGRAMPGADVAAIQERAERTQEQLNRSRTYLAPPPEQPAPAAPTEAERQLLPVPGDPSFEAMGRMPGDPEEAREQSRQQQLIISSVKGETPSPLPTLPSDLATYLLFKKVGALARDGMPLEEALEEARSYPILSPEQREDIHRLRFAAEDEGQFVAHEEFAHEHEVENQYALMTTGEESIAAGFFRSMLPEPVLAAIEQVPYAGGPVRREVEFFTSPGGILTGLAMPGISAQAAAGGIAAGTAAEVAGASENVVLGAQVAGNILTPMGAAGFRPRPRPAAVPEVTARPLLLDFEPVWGVLDDPIKFPKPQPPTAGISFELGDDALRTVLANKEEALLRPGALTHIPGVERGVAFLNPSVSMERGVLVSSNAQASTMASLSSRFDAWRAPVLKGLKDAWRKHRPRYTGPEDNPIANTLKDFADNPDFYTNVSPSLTRALQGLDNVSNQVLATVRHEYGVDVGVFRPSKPGAIYTPTVASKQSMEDMVGALVKGEGLTYTEPASVTAERMLRGRARTRYYDNAYDRFRTNPKFAAETDVEALINAHDTALASRASSDVFREGTAGLTRPEAVETLKPGLRATRDEVANQLASQRARLNTATQTARRLGVTEGRFQALRGQAQRKLDPILEQIDELGDEWGPELSYLSGEARQLELQTRVLDRALKGVRVKRADINIPGLKADIQQTKLRLGKLRSEYANADLGAYRLSEVTRRYHLPDEHDAIGRVTRAPGKAEQVIYNAIDLARGVAFFVDASLLTIQGQLGVLFDPITAVRSARQVATQVARPRGEVIRSLIRSEPELTSRFVESTGRRFGTLGPEVTGTLQNAPFLARLVDAVEVLRYNQWKNDRQLLMRWNPNRAVNVADHEAANTLSKAIPALNVHERGVSPARGALERAPLISPSFTFSPALLMKDGLSGFAKLATARTLNPGHAWGALAGREQLALLRLVNAAGTLMTVSVTSAILSAPSRNKSYEEATEEVVNPVSGKFGSIILGPYGSISLGGPYRSFIRAMAPRFVPDAEEAGKGEWVPFAGLIQFGRAKLNPPFSAFIDFVRNEDYLGRPVVTDDYPSNVFNVLWYVGETFAPLSAGAVMEKFRVGETNPISVALEGASQLAGTNFREATPWEHLELTRDRLAQSRYQVDWDELEPHERASLEKSHGKELTRPDARSERGKDLEARRQIGADWVENQERIDAEYPVGPDWIKAYQSQRGQLAGEYRGWEREHPETAAWLASFPSENPNEEALSGYYQAFDGATTPWGELDVEKLSEALENLETSWTPEQRSYVERNTGLHDTPRVQEYKAAQRVLRPYWNVEDGVWDELRRKDPEFAKYDTLDKFVEAKAMELLRAGVPEADILWQLQRLPVLVEISGVVGDFRLQYRLEHPEVDELLVRWYGNVPAIEQVATGRPRRPSRPTRPGR